MAVTLCPWCQSEIPVEEGQEPEKFCPVCDNEIGGYRTLRVDIGGSEDDEEEAQVADEDEDEDAAYDDERWNDELSFRESGPEGLMAEEAAEKLLDEQEFVPECPNCREYMLEAGERIVEKEHFRPRQSPSLGGPMLEAPFSLTLYVCPSCFATLTQLSEDARERTMRKLSEAVGNA